MAFSDSIGRELTAGEVAQPQTWVGKDFSRTVLGEDSEGGFVHLLLGQKQGGGLAWPVDLLTAAFWLCGVRCSGEHLALALALEVMEGCL